MKPAFTIRQAMLSDVPGMVAVETASWPQLLAPAAEQVASRVKTFPEGQLVANIGEQLMGVVCAQRITAEFLADSPAKFDHLTDSGRLANSHDPHGEIFQLIGVATVRAGRGFGLGRLLVDQEIALARSLPGIRRILGFTRPVHYHRHPELPIDEYVSLRDSQGKLVDPVLSFHLDAGARLVSIHPDFRPADVESHGYGVLIEYLLEGMLSGEKRTSGKNLAGGKA